MVGLMQLSAVFRNLLVSSSPCSSIVLETLTDSSLALYMEISTCSLFFAYTYIARAPPTRRMHICEKSAVVYGMAY